VERFGKKTSFGPGMKSWRCGGRWN